MSALFRTVPGGSGRSGEAGFTLIEVMITVAIVAILSAIALPSYADYVLRGKLVDASTSLLALRTQLEQYYQDNRSYATVTGTTTITTPCLATLPALKDFTLACTLGTPAAGYTATATGKAGGPTAGFLYSIDNTGAQTSTIPAKWTAGTYACWIMKKGATC